MIGFRVYWSICVKPICHEQLSADHPTDRRKTPRYRAKKRIVRDLWIASAAIMALFPIPALVAILALLTTFLGFTILDETA